MLLTSWVRSFRESLFSRRRRARRRGETGHKQLWQPGKRLNPASEQLEERTLLTAFVIDQQFVDATSGPISITNAQLDINADGVPEFDTIVVDGATIDGTGGAGISINISDLTLNRIVFSDLEITGAQGSGVDITLNNVDLVSIAFDTNSVSSSLLDGGIDIDLIDVQADELAIFKTTVVAGADPGLTIDVTSQTRNSVLGELSIAESDLDGVALTASGRQLNVTGGDALNPLQLTIADHGLRDGTLVTVSGVTGLTEANTRDTVTVVDENVIALTNTNGLGGAAYQGGGTVTVFTELTDVRIANSRIASADGTQGLAIALTNVRAPGLSVEDNSGTDPSSGAVREIDSIEVTLNNSPIDGMKIRDNRITADRPSIDGIGIVLNESTLTNLLVDGNVVENTTTNSGDDGVTFVANDSNIYGSFTDNEVLNTLGNGLEFTGTVSTTFFEQNGGPLEVNFASRSSESTLAGAVDATTQSFTVVDASSFQLGQILLIEDEQVYVSDITENVLTVNRGVRGTLALAHPDDATLRSVTDSGVGTRRLIADNNFDTNQGIGVLVDLPENASFIAALEGNRLNNNRSGGVDISVQSTAAPETVLRRGGIARPTLTNPATTLRVEDASLFSRFQTPFDVQVEGEQMRVTAVDGNNLTVVRGINGTQPLFHGSATRVVALDGDGLQLDIGAEDENAGNFFSFNRDIGNININLEDRAAGSFNIVNNVIIGSEAGNADGISVDLLSVDTDVEATNILRRSVIADNLIGTDFATTLPTAITSADTVFNVTDSSGFTVGENVRIEDELITITAINANTLTVTRGAAGTTAADHDAGATLVTLTFRNTERGIDVFWEELSVIEDLQISNNVIANNNDDGIRVRRVDDGISRTFNPTETQTRAITISDNVLVANAAEPGADGSDGAGPAGIDIQALNGTFDSVDVSITGNVVVAQRTVGFSPNGISLRGEADARIEADIIDNEIRFNDGNGVQLSQRSNSATDLRDISGRLLKNTISDNDLDGIHLGIPVGNTSLFIVGLEGNDTDGESFGNAIENNGSFGIDFLVGSSLASITNNDISNNGRINATALNTGGTIIQGSGIAVRGSGSQIAVKDNRLEGNRGAGIDVNTTTSISIRDNLVTDNENDGLELTGSTQATLLGNFIGSNLGRGIDILVASDIANYKIGDGQESGRNRVIGNNLEGIYYNSTADTAQSQNVLSTATLLSGGSVSTTSSAIFQVDTNTIEDNGNGTTFAATGLVSRVGSSGGGSGVFSRHQTGTRTGQGTVSGNGFFVSGASESLNSRTNSRIVNNSFDGNFGDDVRFETYVSTVNPATTSGQWESVDASGNCGFVVNSYSSDPLARHNVVFTGNSGNGLDASRIGDAYNNAEPVFKSRDAVATGGACNDTPTGPFGPGGTRGRSIIHVPTRALLNPDENPTPMINPNPAPDAVYNIVNIQAVPLPNGQTELIVTLGLDNFGAYNGLLPNAVIPGFTDIEINGVRAVDGTLHSANGVFTVDRIVNPGLAGIGNAQIALRGTTGDNGPAFQASFGDYAAFHINSLNSGFERQGLFQYPGLGPGTVLVAQGYDTAGTAPADEFSAGLDFLNPTQGSLVTQWGIWTPNQGRTGSVQSVVPDPMNPTTRLQITSPNHNLGNSRGIRIQGVQGVPSANGSFAVFVTGPNTFTIPATPNGTYTGGGNWVTVDDSFPDPTVPTFPLANVQDVDPDPRATNSGVITFDFTEDVTGVDIDDLFLIHDGVPVDISSVAVQQTSPSQYTIDLGTQTSPEGQYELIIDAQFPLASIVPVSPDPRIEPVGQVTVNFTEDVTGVDIFDFTLARDAGDGRGFQPIDLSELGANQAVTQVTPSQYTLDFSEVSSIEGSYQLTLLAPRTLNVSNVMINANGEAVISAVNHGLSTGQTITISGVIGDTLGTATLLNGTFRILVDNDDTIRLADSTLSTPFIADDTYAGFSALTRASFAFDPGIVDRVGRRFTVTPSGTSADTTEFWVHATEPPRGEIIDVDPDPRIVPLDSVLVQFDEPIVVNTVSSTDFRLTLDVGSGPFPVSLASAIVTPVDVATSTLTLGISATTNTITLLDTTAFPNTPGFDLLIDSEQLRVTAIAGNTYTVTRGVNGTTAASHANGVTVREFGLASLIELSNLATVTSIAGDYRLTLISTDSTRIEDAGGNTLVFNDFDDFTVVNTGPLPDIVDVTRDPRDEPASLVAVSFSEPITNVDLANAGTHFTLTRDTGDGLGPQFIPLVDSTGTPLPIQQSGAQLLQIDLSPVTSQNGLSTGPSIDGTYTLTLNRLTGITSALDGEELSVDAIDSWVQDSVAPTGDILDLDPDPRATAAGAVTVVFSEPVTGVDVFNAATDFTLTRDIGDGNGPQTVSLNGIRVRPIFPRTREGQRILPFLGGELFADTYVMDLGAAGLTDVPGDYVLTLTNVGNIADATDNPYLPNTDSVESWELVIKNDNDIIQDNVFTQRPNPLTLDASDVFFVDQTPPRVAPSTLLETGISDTALTLTVVEEGVFPTTGEFNIYIGTEQMRVTGVSGRTLTVERGVEGTTRQSHLAGATVARTLGIAPDPRSTAVGVVTIRFTEPVTGFNLTDLKLTRDDGAGPQVVPLTGLTVNQITGSEYTIDLNLTTGAPGSYVLSLDGNGSLIKDAAGNDIAQVEIPLDSWTVENIGPTANVDVTPEFRNSATANDTINVTFTKDIEAAQLDADDFQLERDTGNGFVVVATSLTGDAIITPASGDTFEDEFTIDLSNTDLIDMIDGSYRLTLVASDSGIVDEAGIELAANASDTWVLDNTAPTADIIDIAPDPRTDAVGLVNILFSEAVRFGGADGIDISDFTLTRDSGAVAGFSGLSVTQETPLRYTIDLSSVTDMDGTYELTLTTTSPIQDLAGNPLAASAQDAWFIGADTESPTVTITEVGQMTGVMTPRSNPVQQVRLTFAQSTGPEDVTNVDITDIRLFLDGAPVVIDNLTVENSAGSQSEYLLDLSSVTTENGLYTLQVLVSDIQDVAAMPNPLQDAVGGGVAAEVMWTTQTLDPSADFVDVDPDPRLRPVDVVTLNFSQPVTGPGVDPDRFRDSFELTRTVDNGEPQVVSLRNVTLTESPQGPDQYFLDLSRATGIAGTYTLRLIAEGSGIESDLDGDPQTSGDPLTSDAVETWTTATEIVVNTFADTVDTNPGDGAVRDAGMDISLRAAIMEANALPGDDTIILGAGEYNLTINGINEDFAASADLDIRDTSGSLTIIGAGADVTTIDGGALERIFHVFSGATVSISGVTITGGRVVGSQDGGAILNAGGIVTLTDSVVSGNVSLDDAGGINNTGTLTLERVTLDNNSATNTGGALRNAGALTIIESTIGGTFDLTDPQALDLRNRAGQNGGGIINLVDGSITLTNSTISGNESTGGLGGGVFNTGRLTFSNTTIASNHAAVAGGGLTVTGGVVELRNTIIADNTTDSATGEVDVFDFTGGGSFTSLGNNLIGNNTGATAAFPAGAPNGNNDLVGVDPLLAPLTDNGGPTLTQAISFGSPAIDAGAAVSETTDQRGLTRDLNGVDIGAFEFGGFFVNSPEDSIDVNPGDGLALDAFGRTTLRAAVMESNALTGTNAIQLGTDTYVLGLTALDDTAPTADIVDVADPAMATAIDEITVTFSEPVQGLDLANPDVNFDLLFDDGTGPVTVPLLGVTLRQDSNVQYTLENLTGLLAADGRYELRLLTTGITDFALAANPLAEDPALPTTGIAAVDEFVRGADIFAPTATITDIPATLTGNPGLVTVTFNESVTGVTTQHFTLTYDDDGAAGPNAQVNIDLSTVSVQQVSPSEYALNLAGVLAQNGLTDLGEYSLTFDGTAPTMIFDLFGNVFAGAPLTETWTVQADTVAPTVDIVDISPDPRIGAVTDPVQVTFTEGVSGVDLTNAETDFDLFLDVDGFGSGVPATQLDLSGVSVTQISDSEYTLDISDETVADGVYRLVLTTDGNIQDLAATPNALAADPGLAANEAAEDFWITGDAVGGVSSNDAASFGDLDVTQDVLLIFGNGAGTSIVDANDIDRAFDVFTGAALSLEDLTVTNGTVGAGKDGGAIRSAGRLTVTDTSITASTAGGNGGAIYSETDPVTTTLNGTLTSTDPVLTVASAAGFPTTAGFHILIGSEQFLVTGVSANLFTVTRGVNGTTATPHASGEDVTLIDLTIVDSTIGGLSVSDRNTADFGGGIYNDGGVTALGTTNLQGNQALTDGGGFYNDRSGTIAITGGTVAGNTAGRDGAGIYNNDVGTATLNDTTISSNFAVRNGGGVFNEIVATVDLTNSRIAANSAEAGGGLYNEDGRVTFTGGSVIANTAVQDGGGLLATSSAQVTLDDVTLSGNSAGGDGGAVNNDGTLTVTTSLLAGNNASGTGGAVTNTRTLNISESTVSGNTATGRGGGLHNAATGSLTLSDVSISGNTAGSDGGGVANTESGTLTVTETELSGNTSGASGGGLFHDASVTATLSNSTLSANVALNGGGLATARPLTNDGRITVANVTVSGNTATVSGGGIHNAGDDLTVTNATIVNNEATTNAGGIFSTSAFTETRLKNTIVARNTAGTNPDLDGLGFDDRGNNLIGDAGTITAFVNGTQGNLVGTSADPIDPLLSPLQNNGGETLTHALLFGSPARDAGNNVGISAFDQRGFDRTFDGDGDGSAIVDIGAFESGLTVNSFIDTVDANPGDRASADVFGNSTLRAAIMEANALPGADSIVLLPGTYHLTIAGADENDAVTGDLDITEDLTIIGAGRDATFIDANSIDRVFHVLGGATLNLMGVTVVGGEAVLGGGFLNQGRLNLENASVGDATVGGNRADLGAGIYNVTTSSTLSMDLTAGDTAVFVEDIDDFPRQTGFTILIGSEEMRVDLISVNDLGRFFTVTRGFNGTTASAHLAGTTVDLIGTARVDLQNTIVTSNQALLSGGGIFNNDELNVTQSSVIDNFAGVRGGGIYNTEVVTISESTLDNNRAEARGGAIYNEGTVTGTASTITIDQSTLANNDAGALGGAIYNSDRVDITNSTLSANTAGGEGGAVYNKGVASAATAPAGLTFVIDFVEADELPYFDFAGRSLTPFDPADYGFGASQFDVIASTVRDVMESHFHDIVTSDVDPRSPIPAGMQLDIDIVIGDVGTPPSNGATEFYYVSLGSRGVFSLFGQANGIGTVRNGAGAGPNFGTMNGDLVGSTYTDVTALVPGVSGELLFTANAIGGTTSHEIGHTLNLNHTQFLSPFVTPNDLPPLMASGATGIPTPLRAFNREFSLSSFDDFNAPRNYIQELVDGIGLRAAATGSQAPGTGFLGLTNTTIVNNAADLFAGGILNATGSTVEVRNTIIAANSVNTANPLAADDDIRGTFESESFNFIGDRGSSLGFVDSFNNDQVGTSLSPLDPVFGPLQNNGGLTETHALLPGSNAIDNGDNSGGTPIDQRNGRRPTDMNADIGAFEVQDNRLTVSDVTRTEGGTGSNEYIFTVLLETATAEPISVDFNTVQDTARAGEDFLPVAGTLTFAPGDLVQTISVVVNGDSTPEDDEQFFLQLSNPVNGTLLDAVGVGTILNDDAVVEIADQASLEGDGGSTSLAVAVSDRATTITVADASVLQPLDPSRSPMEFEIGSVVRIGSEDMQVTAINGNDLTVVRGFNGSTATSHLANAGVQSLGVVTFTVTLSKAIVEDATVDFTIGGGTAIFDDYDQGTLSGTLTYAAGETSKTINVLFLGDVTSEDHETVNVTLSNAMDATGDALTVPDATAVATILNDDVSLSLTGVSDTEGTGGLKDFGFSVNLANPVAIEVTVEVETTAGTATSGTDFVALANEVVTIPAELTNTPVSVTQNVQVVSDSQFEGGTGTFETFELGFVANSITRNGVASTGTLGANATGSIEDDEPRPVVWTIQLNAAQTMRQVIRTDDSGSMTVYDQPVANATLEIPDDVDSPFDVETTPMDDQFVVDFVNGNPIPDNGLIVNGLNQIAGDSLEIVDTSVGAPASFTDVTYTATGANSGTIEYDDGTDTFTITYTGLEPVRDDLDAANRTFTINSALVAGDVPIRIADASNDQTIIDSNGTASFENITFNNPSTSLTVNAGSGSNMITVQALDTDFDATGATLTVNGEGGDDTIDASAFNFGITINAAGGNDIVTGSAFADVISGGDGTDNITAGDGDDMVQGNDDADVIDGGAGADNISGDQGDDQITGGLGNDVLDGGTGDDNITGDDGNDNITGGDNNDSLSGGIGNDTIDGEGGQDTVEGGDGQDTVDGGADADTVDGGADIDEVHGGAGNDIVNGGDGDDVLDGGDDNDTLDGGQGVDDIDGGLGVDQLSGSVTGSQNATLTNTTFDVAGQVDMFVSIEEVIIIGGTGSNVLDAQLYTDGAVTVDGGDGNDSIFGSAGPDSLNGGLGDDMIDAGDGNDTIFGGGGRDTIDAGAGNDVASGNSGNDSMDGGDGFDSMSGGDGDDTMNGGANNDTLDGDIGNDLLMGNGGNDRLTGDAGHDVIHGNDGLDRLFGSAGDDTMFGGANRDTVNGGAGRDEIDGGGDKDRLLGGAGGDTLITNGDGVDTLNGQGSSLDTVLFRGSESADTFLIRTFGGTRIEVRRFGGVAGARDRLVRTERITVDLLGGDDVVNVLDGLTTIAGRGTFTLNLGAGNDTVDASLSANPNFNYVVNAGSGDDIVTTGTGNDNVDGGDGNDVITLGSGDDTGSGGDGADNINGNAGIDVLDGGTGDDTLLGGSEGDSILAGAGNDSVNGNGGNDTIFGGDGQDLIFGEGGGDNIFGENDADRISGGDGNDNIFGGGGNDIIRGEDGEDFIEGGNGNDIISGGLKNDRINGQDGADSLFGDADDDTLTGGAREDLVVGGRGADDIDGQGTNRDTLVGETGLEGADDDTPDPGDTFDNPAEVNNAFVVPTAIFDALNGF